MPAQRYEMKKHEGLRICLYDWAESRIFSFCFANAEGFYFVQYITITVQILFSSFENGFWTKLHGYDLRADTVTQRNKSMAAKTVENAFRPVHLETF